MVAAAQRTLISYTLFLLYTKWTDWKPGQSEIPGVWRRGFLQVFHWPVQPFSLFSYRRSVIFNIHGNYEKCAAKV